MCHVRAGRVRNGNETARIDASPHHSRQWVKYLTHEYASFCRLLSPLTATAERRSVRWKRLHQKAKEYSDDKVQLAMQLYEMIDKHIRRLDTDLTRFEQELQLKESTQRRASVASMDGPSTSQQSHTRKRSLTEATAGTSTRRKKHHSVTDESGFQSISSPSGSGLGSNGTDIPMDMPVDPNEPTILSLSPGVVW